MLVTSATALAWSLIAPEQALWISLSVLVISCPCALALATPAALTSAANALRSSGVIVRGENAIEALSRATHLIFDKTGTLTEGALQLSAVHPLGSASAVLQPSRRACICRDRTGCGTATSRLPRGLWH